MENNNEQRQNINDEKGWNPFTATPKKDSDEAKAQEKFLTFYKEFNPIIDRYTRDVCSEIFHIDEENIKIPEIKTTNKKNKQKNKKKAKESAIAQQKKEKTEFLKKYILTALKKDIELKKSRNILRDCVTKSIEEFVANFFNINDKTKGKITFSKLLTETEKLFQQKEANPRQKQCYIILLQKNENTNPLTFFEKAKKELDKFGQKNDDIETKMKAADHEYVENTIKKAINIYLIGGLLGVYSKHTEQYHCRTYIKASEVEKYNIICIDQCEAKHNTWQPERRSKVGIVINTDGGRIDCLLLNSHDDNKHYPNMKVKGESVKVNNKDIYIGNEDDNFLPFGNIFVKDKNTSYISQNTYALTDNDKENIYRCGYLEKDNEKHIKLIDDIKAAAKEGINNDYDKYKNYDRNRQIKYSQLLKYIEDFPEGIKEKSTIEDDKKIQKKTENNNTKIETNNNDVSDGFLMKMMMRKKMLEIKKDNKEKDIKEKSSAEKNNYVAKINTENANNTNSINFK